MLCDCLALRRVADLLNVRVQLLLDLVEAGYVDHHRHGARLKITKAGVDELRWRLALAQSDA